MNCERARNCINYQSIEKRIGIISSEGEHCGNPRGYLLCNRYETQTVPEGVSTPKKDPRLVERMEIYRMLSE